VCSASYSGQRSSKALGENFDNGLFPRWLNNGEVATQSEPDADRRRVTTAATLPTVAAAMNEITNLDHRRRRQVRWRQHSLKEQEALEDLELAIERYLTQVSPENINNAAFVDQALPHVEKINQLFATTKPKRLSMLRNTLHLTAQTAANPKERK
jgi:hypothetical protein